MNLKTMRECFDYNAASGELTWKSRPIGHFKDERAMKIFNTRRSGTAAGTPQKITSGKTYMYVRVSGKSILVHRICYALHFGVEPNGEIDHINGDGTDNRIDNIRLVTKTENSRNQRLRSTNKSGHTGVVWHKAARKWCAQITVNGSNINLGLHECKCDAIKARKCAEVKYGFHKNHGMERPL